MTLCRRAVLCICIGIFGPLAAVKGDSGVSFAKRYLDTDYGGSGKPGWVRCGDMDGDGDPDIVAGGGRALYVYRNDAEGRRWQRFGNLDGTEEMGANGAVLFDVDADADLDVVCARYKKDLGWWENPGGQLGNGRWQFHEIDAHCQGWFAHDMQRFDLDGDGRGEELVVNYQKGYWDAPVRIFWYELGRSKEEPWKRHVIANEQPGHHHCHAGLDAGDIDGDGHIDLAYSNGWFEASDDPADSWTWHPVTDVYGISNVVLGDVDADGDLDLVLSAGHHGRGVYWYANPGKLTRGSWQQHIINADIRNPEGLALVDLDKNGRLDVVACELDFDNWDKQHHNLYVFLNAGSQTPTWNKQTVAPSSYASHQLGMADINQDGKEDLISEGCGYGIVSYYENTTRLRSPNTTGKFAAWRHHRHIRLIERAGVEATSFPVSLQLDAEGLDREGKMRRDGADIRVTVADREVPYQTEQDDRGETTITFQIDLKPNEVRDDIVLHYGNASAKPPEYDIGWGSIDSSANVIENALLRISYGLKTGTYGKKWGCQNSFVIKSVDEDQFGGNAVPGSWAKSRNDVTYWKENVSPRIDAVETEGPVYRRIRFFSKHVDSDDHGRLTDLSQRVTLYRNCSFIKEEYKNIKGAVVDVATPGGMPLRSNDKRNFDYVAFHFNSRDITWEGRGPDRETRGGWTADFARADKDPRYRYLDDDTSNRHFMMGVVNLHNGRGVASCVPARYISTCYFVDWRGQRAGYSFWPRAGGTLVRYLYCVENGPRDAIARGKLLATPPKTILGPE
ncbi:MAG: FG-GAP repeat domain-containing protein [Planctomycetota bacterium]|jgi:hypothetical protein